MKEILLLLFSHISIAILLLASMLGKQTCMELFAAAFN